MKIIKYGSNFPALSDYDIVSKLEDFSKDIDLIETSTYLIIEGVRSYICEGYLNHEEVEIHLVEIEEVHKCDKNGSITPYPDIYGENLNDCFLDSLLKLSKFNKSEHVN